MDEYTSGMQEMRDAYISVREMQGTRSLQNVNVWGSVSVNSLYFIF